MKLQIVNQEDEMQAERLKAIGTVMQRKALRAQKLARLREQRSLINENISRELYQEFEDEWRLSVLSNTSRAIHEILPHVELDDSADG